MSARVLTDRWWREVKRNTVWRVEGWLLAWMEAADEGSQRGDLLAECECGDMWVPSRTHGGWWDRMWCWWKPTHWPAYIRSRRARAYVMIEHEGGAS
jgi:hypothetical protein